MLALALLHVCTPLPAAADMYVKHNPDGTVSITDVPMEEGFELRIRTEPEVVPWREYARIVAERNNLEEKLVRAVIYVESGEDPLAVSSKGAQGLMQLMPGTAEEVGVTDPLAPRDNVRGGISYLAQMLRRFDGDIRLALAAYNAGPAAVEKYGGIPPYPETQRYVEKVMKIYQKANLGEDNT